MRTTALFFLICLTASLGACFSSTDYHQRQFQENRLEIDEYNCRWQLTHTTDEKGEVTAIAVDEQTLAAKVHECMEARGHDAALQADTDADAKGEKADKSGGARDSGSWWWPF